MRTVKRIFSLVPLLLLWLMLCVLVWSFVFTRITDTAPENKIVLWVNAQGPRATDMAVQLEEKLSGRIAMVQVRPFGYALMGADSIQNADLYIVRAADVDAYRDWFAPLPAALREESTLSREGVPLGITAYSAADRFGIAEEYIEYETPGDGAQDYYLLVGASSLHNPDAENAADGLAVDAARLLPNMP